MILASFWQQMPFVRFIIPFIAGILLQHELNLAVEYIFVSWIFSGILAWIFLNKIRKIYHLWMSGILLNFFLIFFGMCLTWLQNDNNFPDFFKKHHFRYLIVKIDESVTSGKNTDKTRAVVLQGIDSLHHLQSLSGNLLLYFKKDSLPSKLQYGDVLLIKSQIQEISSPANPGEFNYKKYLQSKHIYYQSYLTPKQYKIIKRQQGSKLFQIAFQSQDYIRETLHTYVSGKNETGVGEALLFGFDDDIDMEIFNAYSRTGTLHVLAVSGMHVALIFMVLSFFLTPLQKIKKLKLLKPALLLTGIWLYSVLCGLSPSILRASIMLSFMVIGELINRKSNTFNSLAASAFLLLVSDTSVISNVGFQLSYAAVLGIISFYQMIYEGLDFSTRIGDMIWQVISVSLAAQTLTFPMSLFYFHQFPNYFLLANLLIIPITTLIIYNGILLLIFSKFIIISKALGFCMLWLISISNSIVAFIEKLPGSYIESIHFSIPVLLLTYSLLIVIVIYFNKRDVFIFKIGLTFILLISLVQFWENYQSRNQKELIIYSIKDHTCIQIIKGKEATTVADSNLIADPANLNFHIQGLICQSEISKENKLMLPMLNSVIEITPLKKMLILHVKSRYRNMRFDLVLIEGRKYLNLEEILKKNQIRQLVLGNNIPSKKRIILKKIAAIYHIPCYDITENGAFQLSL